MSLRVDSVAYAEPVLAAELLAGEVYFVVNSGEERLFIPFVNPLVFIGRNLEEGDTDSLYFQSFESYAAGVHLHPMVTIWPMCFTCAGFNHIFEYGKALDRLMA